MPEYKINQLVGESVEVISKQGGLHCCIQGASTAIVEVN
jgi:hypothetical protein